MSPRLYLVRHAQGFHNSTRDLTLLDPVLTEKGKGQCRDLRNSFQHHSEIDLVLTSPLRRTIQTAALSFGPTLSRDIPFVAVPEAQEVGHHRSDTGLAPSELQKELDTLFANDALDFDIKKLNLDAVKEGWNGKTGYWAWDRTAISKRAADLRSWIFNRPEERILLVTHGAFLHFLTEDWDVRDPMNSTAYHNCELREFVFTAESTEEDAHLAETTESKRRRGKTEHEQDPHILADLRGSVEGEQ
ncbi:phosphoglycerate mutase family protein-like protein [Sporormia fimetaria CBS 119925]|uniref:Phosphoglycerate mutase family protein-like protein n=1 Tax=Sporormia fimetaria CBS 119925 TaxID=1340428 RepID=A0A6A6V5R2_9PLEO|nr:phosphoglycerate mutase family protein-like protein [Sporormia fimetaria CBS 119925]